LSSDAGLDRRASRFRNEPDTDADMPGDLLIAPVGPALHHARRPKALVVAGLTQAVLDTEKGMQGRSS